jgi:Glycosyl hydrolase family 3 C-terminal domain
MAEVPGETLRSAPGCGGGGEERAAPPQSDTGERVASAFAKGRKTHNEMMKHSLLAAIISRVADEARGIVMAYWPGMYGGDAIADVLFGDVNPSGKLPFTYPRHPNALATYDHRYTESTDNSFGRGPGGFDPQWEFGHGLSYTTFAYRDLRVATPAVAPADSLVVRVTVQNTGARAGRETVLLFTRQHYASVTPSMRRLRAFHPVELAPGRRGRWSSAWRRAILPSWGATGGGCWRRGRST